MAKVNVYKFPIKVQESVRFAVRGKVIKAELLANDFLLSSKTIDYKTIDVDHVDLGFFMDRPFHGCLASEWETVVAITVKGKKVPTLIMKPDEETMTWERVGKDIYKEPVTTFSDSKPTELIMVYTPRYGGFLRPSS